MVTFEWLARELLDLSALGLAREPMDAALRSDVQAAAHSQGLEFVDASSNDYLGYGALGTMAATESLRVSVGSGMAQGGEQSAAGCGTRESTETHLVSRETLTPLSNCSESTPIQYDFESPPKTGPVSGAGASRLLGGTAKEHTELERLLAEWVGQEESLLFSSGYAANVGLLSSLPQRGDTVFSDANNHASIIDGCRLSHADTIVYPHLDLSALATLLRERRPGGHCFIVTESYFSMDADSPDLIELRALANQHAAALIVDEAHALGIYGPQGAGLAAQRAVKPDIVVGTLGKAVGLQGAFVAGPTVARSWLWNRARSFVYSTATTPTLAWQTQLHVKHIQTNDTARARLMRRAEQIRCALAELGLAAPPNSHGPIIPVLFGSVGHALDAAQALRARGILAYPIRPPTVPRDSARVRLTVTASMSEAAFAHLLKTLPRCIRPESPR